MAGISALLPSFDTSPEIRRWLLTLASEIFDSHLEDRPATAGSSGSTCVASSLRSLPQNQRRGRASVCKFLDEFGRASQPFEREIYNQVPRSLRDCLRLEERSKYTRGWSEMPSAFFA